MQTLDEALARVDPAEAEEAAAMVARLVAIPSITVLTGELPPDERHGEAAMVREIAGILSAAGIQSEAVEVEPQRPQLTARIGGPGRDLVLTTHTDTVTPVAWPRDPFLPVREAHRLYGLGACDDKGSLTAMLLAIRRLAARPEGLPGTVTFVAMMGEETFGIGSRHLVRSGYRPDVAIVGEPTEMRLVRVECGNIRWRISTLGKAAHGSRPWEGESAVYRMADVLRVLRDIAVPRICGQTHPLIGRAAFNVGLVSGGSSVNIVPDRCTLTVERRLLPGEDPHEGMNEVNSLLVDRLGGDWLEFEPPASWNYPLETADEAAVTLALRHGLATAGLSGEPAGVSFGSDANRFAEAGVPCLVFGPGSIRQAHTNEEWVDVREVALAARVLEAAVLRFLGGA